MRKPLFTTVEDFEQATSDLRPHFGKGIGLNALRTAIAKAHGFNHVSAYREHLAQTTVTSRERSAPGFLSEAPNPNIFVKVLGDIIYLQGLIDEFDLHQSIRDIGGKTHSREWQAQISELMTGTKALRNIETLNINGRPYIRGYFDIGTDDSHRRAVTGVRTFLEEQVEDSYGHIVYQILFNQIYSAMRADHLGYADRLAALGSSHEFHSIGPAAARGGSPCTHELRIDRENIGDLMRLTFARFQPYMDKHDGREVLEGAFDQSRFERHLAEVVQVQALSGRFASYDALVDRAYVSMMREAMGLMENRLIIEYRNAHRDHVTFTGDELRIWFHENYENLYSVLLGDVVFGRSLYVDSVTDIHQRRI